MINNTLIAKAIDKYSNAGTYEAAYAAGAKETNNENVGW